MKLWFKRGSHATANARNIVQSLSRDQIKNIAVIRHAALGDMVLTRCFLVELRKAFKNAHITLSISSNYTRGVPEDLIDKLHIVHGSDRKNIRFSERVKNFKELGDQDIIFDLAATNRSFMTCMFNSATLKIGFPYRPTQAKLFYDITVSRSDITYEVENMLNMLHVMGIKTTYPYVYNMPGENLVRHRPYMVYFAGASVPSKCWPTKYFRRLMLDMSDKYPDHDHLLLEGIMEWEKSIAILGDNIAKDNVGSISADTVEDTVSLLKGSDLVIANDTGIRNLAIVCDTPTVGIFFSTFPFRYWPRFSNHDIIFPDGDGVPTVEEVFASCSSVLEEANK